MVTNNIHHIINGNASNQLIIFINHRGRNQITPFKQICFRDDVNVRTVIRYLRLLKEMPIDTDQIFVVDRAYKYLGSIHISTLLTNEAEQNIAPLINKNFHPIVADMPEHEVANLFERRDLISAPVVDKNNQLIGDPKYL
jgi:magnesium transporter